MFAIVRSGGKQYRMEVGQFMRIEKLSGEANTEITLNDVLLYSDGENIKIGKPTVSGAQVSARIVRQLKGPKVIVYKYRRRKDSASKKGHRHCYTEIQITGIKA